MAPILKAKLCVNQFDLKNKSKKITASKRGKKENHQVIWWEGSPFQWGKKFKIIIVICSFFIYPLDSLCWNKLISSSAGGAHPFYEHRVFHFCFWAPQPCPLEPWPPERQSSLHPHRLHWLLLSWRLFCLRRSINKMQIAFWREFLVEADWPILLGMRISWKAASRQTNGRGRERIRMEEGAHTHTHTCMHTHARLLPHDFSWAWSSPTQLQWPVEDVSQGQRLLCWPLSPVWMRLVFIFSQIPWDPPSYLIPLMWEQVTLRFDGCRGGLMGTRDWLLFMHLAFSTLLCQDSAPDRFHFEMDSYPTPFQPYLHIAYLLASSPPFQTFLPLS